MSENKLLDNVKKEYVVGIGLIVFAVLWMISNLLDLDIFRDLLMIVAFLVIIANIISIKLGRGLAKWI